MTLYQIDPAIAECIDPETGEVLDIERLEALNKERETKIENIALWIKNDLAEAKAIREEEKALEARRRSLERQADSKTNYLKSVLNGEKFSTPRCSISYRKTTSVEVSDMGAVVAWMIDNGYDGEVTYSATVSKTNLAPLLKNGAHIDGAALVHGLSMGVK